MSEVEQAERGEEIAVVGMAGRFPGARNLDEFWENLRGGVESISFFAEDELELSGPDAEVRHDPRLVRAGGVLAGAEMFDASFFGFSPREAELTDPQHRVFLECAWEALEHAGCDAERCRGPVGVYAGVSMNTYLMNLYSNREFVRSAGHLQIGIGNDKDFLPTRVSYKLNLTGPSLTVQTACSTSLVAVHVACQSLLDGQCDVALAGGVSVSLPQKTGYLYQEGGIHSPDGHCRAFDADGRGFVKGNGVGVVVLKRLEDALADGDTVHAVIKGSAVNNDGSLKVGYTAPSEIGQSEVIASALAMAGVSPDTITYVEAHGTGTPLGDPIELAALNRVFGARTRRRNFCAIGSVKTNVGHLDAAAGVAGLLKTVLALKHGMIPPSLNFSEPNPQIDFAGSPFFVADKLRAWDCAGRPRRAGVSSFGIGGTNAHVVLEEAPAPEPTPSRWPAHLLPLSAKTASALEQATANLAEHLRAHADVNLPDAAYTLQVGRKAFKYRRAVVCRGLSDAPDALRALDPRQTVTGECGEGERAVAFMFSGQGAQYVGMGRGLYEFEPTFREQVDACAEMLRPHLGLDIRGALYPPEGEAEEAARQLGQTRLTQPALFVVEYALARMWMGWGVRPQGLIGHSVGEYVAACVAGVLTLEDALRLVAVRGRLMQEAAPGAMLAVSLAEREARGLLADGRLSLAAVNSPVNCVVSGEAEAVEELAQRLRRENVECRRLDTSHAFHSAMMEGVVGPFVEEVKKVRLRAPQLPYVSNVTGDWMTDADARDPAYWGRHLREAVRFGDGVAKLIAQRCALLEVGPGQTLCTLARRQAGKADAPTTVPTLRHPQDAAADAEHLLKSVAQLWTAGVALDWEKLYEGERRRRIPLPSYPFERERYWVEARPDAFSAAPTPTDSGRKKEPDEWFYVPVWKESGWPAPAEPADEEGGARERWLLFADECGLSEELVGELGARGSEVVTVYAGAAFERLAADAYVVNPARRSDYETLLAQLRATGRTPDAVCHAWNVTRERGGPPDTSLDAPFFSLLFLAQALGAESSPGDDGRPPRPRRIFVVSNNMQEVGGEDWLCPEKATLVGLCRVIPQEHPALACRSVDVSLPAHGPRRYRRLAARLASELTSEASEPFVAYRGGHRLVQSYEPLKLPSAHARRAPLREGGVYLLTGGLSGAGLEVAEYLARAVRARLVLLGGDALPAREEWDAWLATHDEGDRVSGLLRAARRLLDAGGEVLYLGADLTSRAEVERALEEAARRFGRVRGVVHAAGDGLIEAGADETDARALSTIVAATRVLGDVLQDSELDFFVLCSSLDSVQGVAGRGAAGAADAFLDAFARAKTLVDGVLTQSVNWPDAVASPARGMTTDEVGEAFRRAVGSGLPRVVVAPRGLESLSAHGKARAADSGGQAAEAPTPYRAAHQRPALRNAYGAPRDETEEVLARLWQELLGIERVGIHDNFFDLGGDSIISLRIIARANQAGLQLSPKQFFERQTIAELAAVAGTAPRVRASQETVTGEAPLTPVQHWFFEQEFVEPHHWNQAVLLEVRRALRPKVLERAWRRLLEHHDALRLRFRRAENGWRQHHADDTDGQLAFERLDLAGEDEAGQRRIIEERAGRAQAALNFTEGPLLRVVFFDLGAGRRGRLLVVAHHLVIDAVSWRVLLEDLTAAYEQLEGGAAVTLPPKTTSFKEWAGRLAEFAQTAAVREDLAYWQEATRGAHARLPLDYPEGANLVGSARTVSVSLSVEETTALLQEVPALYQTQVNEALLAALALTLRGWGGGSSLLLEMEAHGREALFADFDLSRTVGWFTSVFPVLLRLDGEPGAGEALRLVKEQLRRVPHHGLSYGLLRYLTDAGAAGEQLRRLPQPELGFLYLGQFDQELSGAALFGLAEGERAGLPQSPRARRSHLFDVEGYVTQGRLRVTWTYSENLHRAETVRRLADDFLASLRALISHCQTGGAASYSPSDFPDAELSQQELDKLVASFTELED